MKKHVLIPLAVIFLSVIGCSKPENGGGKDNPQPPAPPQEQITIPSTVDVTPVVPSEGGDAKITFTAATAWTASVISTKADSWVDVNPKSGDPGPAEIKITTTPNDTYVERNATIQIKCGTETKDVVLTQKQVDNITVTTDKVELGAEGGTFTIELKSNIDFSYEIKGDWIKYVSTKAYSDKTLTFTAEPNDGVQKREGSVTVKGGEFSETVKVYQSGEEPTLIITQNEYNLEAEGGNIAVEVSSNVAVTMTIPENVNWITENKTKSVSTSTFHLDVAANETYEARSAEITFSNEESGLSEKVTVNQKGGDKENFVHFEDSPELEAYLIGEFDLDGDGRLSEEEASRVTSINLDNTDIEFTSLKGIEYFVNLQELRASGEYYMYDESVGYEQWQQREQKISGTVDLTKNTKLCHIWMRRHRITDLKLPKTQTITLIEIYDNLLTEINVSQCPRLNDLSISNNRLSNLDISENPEIMSLFASSNQLAEIDLSHNRKLSGLELAANQLTSIDLSANTNLSYLNLNYNNLSYLDVSKLSNLRSLYCADNHNLKYLVVSREQTIENIYPNRGDWQYIPESTEIIFDDEFRITPQSCEANYVGDVIEIEVISLNGSQISSVPDWVKLLGSAADGILNKFSFLVEANTSGTERSGHIVICDDGGECHSVAITQKNQAGHEVLDWREADFHHRSLVMWLASTAYGVCPPMAEAVEIVRNEHPDKIEVISMHEKKSTLYFYGVDLMLNRFRPNVIPIAMVDCRKEVNISDINTTANMIFGAAQETEENYKAVTGISFNSAINGNTLDVDVSVYAKVAEEFKIAVVLLEDGIVADQAGAEQGYIHYDVPRLNLSSSMEGDLFTVSQAGTVVPLHFSGTIPDNCVKRNCRVLVYIQRKFGSQRVVQTSGYGEWYVDNCVSGRAGNSVPLALDSDGAEYLGGNEDITPGSDINF